MNDIAKVSRRGRRQMVALPEGVQVEGDQLRVRRDGRNLVLERVESGAGNADWIDKIMGTLDEDFARAALDRPRHECRERRDHSPADALPD